MPPRTVATAMLIDLIRRSPVREMTMADIHRARAGILPQSPPLSWLTGRVDPDVGIRFATAPARDGYEIPLRIYRPRAIPDRQADVPLILWFHGGGWVLGNVVNYDPICTELAAALGAVVVSVDYRLAPEHPAPTAARDCIDAARWLNRHADKLSADCTRMAVAGDSAGGNLTAVVAQAMREPDPIPLRAQVLIYPATDATMSAPSIAQHARGGILTRDDMYGFRDHYCPAGTDLRDPLISPLFGNCHDLPAALIQTADLDPVRDDGIRYAARLEAGGTAVRLTNYRRVPHGFASFPGGSRQGRLQRREMVAFLRGHLR